MYTSDAKNKNVQSPTKQLMIVKTDSQEDDDESYKPLEQRVMSRQWKVRMEAYKQIN
jgi:hypothetical protein